MRVLGVAALLFSFIAAAECPRPEGVKSGSVGGQDDAARLAFLVKKLQHDGHWARTRIGLFGGGLSAAVIGQLALAATLPESDRPAMYWGAGASAVGVASVLFNPLEVVYGGDEFARKAANATPENTCELIAEGERMLFKGADQELAARAWYMHVLNVAFNVAFNVGVGMAIGFIHKLWTNAVVNGLVGIAIGEAMLFTVPLGLVHGRDAYRGKASPVSFMLSPTAGPGLGLTMTF